MSFESPDTWWLVLRTVVLLAAFAVLARALLVARSDAAIQFAQLTQQHAYALAEIQRLAVQVGEIQAQVHDLSLPSPMATRPSAPPPPPPAVSIAPQARGYEMAIRMARGGASIEDISSACGTTRAEARLLLRLHCTGGAHAA